jgi:hypothetical protein
MIRHKGALVAVVGLAALVSGGWFLQRQTEPAGSVYQQARLFDDVLRTSPTTTSTRSTSASCIRWQSTGCSISSAIPTRSS